MVDSSSRRETLERKEGREGGVREGGAREGGGRFKGVTLKYLIYTCNYTTTNNSLEIWFSNSSNTDSASSDNVTPTEPVDGVFIYCLICGKSFTLWEWGEGRGVEREGGRGSTTINGNFSLIKEKLHMHLAHTNWNQSRQHLSVPPLLPVGHGPSQGIHCPSLEKWFAGHRSRQLPPSSNRPTGWVRGGGEEREGRRGEGEEDKRIRTKWGVWEELGDTQSKKAITWTKSA